MKAVIAIPATLALVYRAYSHKSLTPLGILTAALTAAAHAVHPWNLPFVLLCVFFLAGTRVTKIKANVKSGLTLHSQGSAGGEGPRTHVQVLANSLMASILTLMHAYQLHMRRDTVVTHKEIPEGSFCYRWGGDILVLGIIANYAAVCADTFSSELGILSRSSPRLITSFSLRKVPPGTNGGVTIWGLVAGLLGSMIIVATSLMFLPFCGEDTKDKIGGGESWTTGQKATLAWGLCIWGALGSLLDSFLGGWFQRSVRDVRSGKIVEGEGGLRVLTSPSDAEPHTHQNTEKNVTTNIKASILHGEGGDAVESRLDSSKAGADNSSKDPYDPKDRHRSSHFGDRRPTRVAESGFDLLDNNDVNFLMAFTMSVGAIVLAGWYWQVPLEDILKP
ncbi:Transmembrane protein 19 [Daldinia childiae]|uniref:Transmembrane protein 19 n=1 Tax=Daldinia childiae TaxID=326645 RepID=UPI001445783C|nr:Transmembrane protein 19 [Daldinia childiae]KAF3066406.1 Transmembrane protein 19 [Daldinia childiae]